MSNWISVLRKPDFVTGATEESPLRFEENSSYGCPVQYEYLVGENSAKVMVYPSGSPVKYLKLRFHGDFSFVDKVYGDQWERSSIHAYLEWRSVMSSRVLPWFCYLRRDNQTACYGVKTGADCFAFWQVDTHGITLFLNLCCGNDGTDLQEPLLACEVVQLFGEEGEDVYQTAKAFSKRMCEHPVLPKTPIFGLNNWYWAYGNISREIVISETDYLKQMTAGCKHKPYMVIDAGWQRDYHLDGSTYNGGPWIPNGRFGDMQRMAEDIYSRGALPGLWERPLLTHDTIPDEARLASCTGGEILDPTHPFAIEKIYNDTSRIRGWGYDLIKHDFTTFDLTGNGQKQEYEFFLPGRRLYDRTKTTATVVKDLYRTIQRAAGDAEVIGCNVYGHLSAGIHSIQRIGGDTSGFAYEWTKRDGVNTVMRLPTNNSFYNADPDCAAFTDKVPTDINLDFLEMCAYTGMVTIASVTPNLLTAEEMKRINAIYKIADAAEFALGIKNYDKTAEPEIFVSEDGKTVKKYDWTKPYNGSRVVLQWKE